MQTNFQYKMVVIDKEVYCDFCRSVARYDGKTVNGMWAYMCKHHFKEYGKGLGLGIGQQLIVRGEYE
jgi:hypothetical protein